MMGRPAAWAVAIVLFATSCSPATPAPSAGARSQPPASVQSAQPSLTSTAEPTATTAPSDSAEAFRSPSTARAYLALGDSITFGIGVPRPQRNGFVTQVAEALAGAGEPPIETRVFAVPGETATGFLERRLDDVVGAIEELGPRIELVTIGLGANELLRARRDPACRTEPSGEACAAIVAQAVGSATEALRTIVIAVQAALEANGAAPRIALIAYYNPDARPTAASAVAGTDGAVGCSPAEPAPGLDDRIACIARERGAVLVDLHAAFLGREAELTRFRAGDVHPNADGYAVIAETILAAIGE